MISASAWWRIDGWPTTGEWQAVWAFVTVLVAVVAAWVAIRQLNAHYEAQREQSRPFVIVDFGFHGQLLLIEVRNIGATPAINIRLTWDPNPVSPTPERCELLARRLQSNVIPFLAPGRTIQHLVSSMPDYLQSKEMPRRYRVVAKYSDAVGNQYGVGEEMILDLDQWLSGLVQEDYQEKNWREIKRLVKIQKGITQSVEKLRLEIMASRRTAREGLRTMLPLLKDSEVRWMVSFESGSKVHLTNVGNRTAHGLQVEDLTGEVSAFHLESGQESPREVAAGDSVVGYFRWSYGVPQRSQLRLSWFENGNRKKGTTIWID